MSHRAARIALFILGLMAYSLALAACPEPTVTDREGLIIRAPEVLLVTHPSRVFDPRMSSKRGIDEAVRFAKARGMPVLYLKDDGPISDYFVDDCSPSHWLSSKDGELPVTIDASTLYVAGGHLELCLSRSLHEVLEQWVGLPERNRHMVLFMDAIYSNGRLFDEVGPYTDDLRRFLSVMNYRRPGGESWPKLSLLETMGIIIDPASQDRYLIDALPRWERSMPAQWSVEMKNDDGRVYLLREGTDRKGPTLQFEFQDSALDQ